MMRKLKLIVLTSALVGVASCSGEDGRPTYPSWSQTVLQIAEADPDLSEWAKAVRTAGLDETYGGTQAVFTVFAPTNSAFSGLPAAVKDSPSELSRYLRFHTVNAKQLAALLRVQTDLNTLTSTTITVRVSGETITLWNSQGASAMVTQVDLNASNGVLHKLGGFLTPPPLPVEPLGTIVDVATEDGSYGSYLGAIDDAGLTETLSGAGPVTALAPNDAAFTAFGDLAALDADVVANIAYNHVVDGDMSSAAIFDGTTVTTLGKMNIAVDGAGMTVGGASFAAADTAADNGVLHGLGAVIAVPTIQQVADARWAAFGTGATRSTTVAAAISPNTVPGGDAPVTVFVPNDAAFTAAGIDTMTVGTSTLTPILLHHVAAGQIVSGDMTDGQTITTMNGNLTINVDGAGAITVTDGAGNMANVVNSDYRTLSGVIHVIDAVLMPQ